MRTLRTLVLCVVVILAYLSILLSSQSARYEVQIKETIGWVNNYLIDFNAPYRISDNLSDVADYAYMTAVVLLTFFVISAQWKAIRLGMSKERHYELEKQLDALKAELNALDFDTKDSERECDRLHQIRNDLQNQVDDFKSQLDVHVDAVAIAQFRATEERLKRTEENLALAHLNNQKLREKAVQDQIQLAILQRTKSEMEQQVSILSGRISTAENDLEKVAQERNRLAIQNARLNTGLGPDVTEEIDKILKDVENLHNLREQAVNDYNANRREAFVKHINLLTLTQVIASLKDLRDRNARPDLDKIREAARKEGELVAKYQGLEHQLDTLTKAGSGDKLATEVAELKGEIQTLREEESDKEWKNLLSRIDRMDGLLVAIAHRNGRAHRGARGKHKAAAVDEDTSIA